MAIQEITSPPMLDETGQDVVDKLQTIANNINNNAGQINYSNATSQLQATKVQTAIDEVKGITDTISSNLTNLIKSKNISGTTNAGGAVSSGLYSGNNPIIHVVIYSSGATYFGTISQVSDSSNLQYITVHNANGAIVANTAITGIVYYLDLSAI